MKTREAITSALTIITLVLGGCSDARQKQAAKEIEQKRIEAEQQAQADAAKANKAITTNNQKMFSRMNSSSPGAKNTSEETNKAPEGPPPPKN